MLKATSRAAAWSQRSPLHYVTPVALMLPVRPSSPQFFILQLYVLVRPIWLHATKIFSNGQQGSTKARLFIFPSSHQSRTHSSHCCQTASNLYPSCSPPSLLQILSLPASILLTNIFPDHHSPRKTIIIMIKHKTNTRERSFLWQCAPNRRKVEGIQTGGRGNESPLSHQPHSMLWSTSDESRAAYVTVLR